MDKGAERDFSGNEKRLNLIFKRKEIEKEIMMLGIQKPSRCQQKRTQVWMKTYLCCGKTELKQSYIPII